MVEKWKRIFHFLDSCCPHASQFYFAFLDLVMDFSITKNNIAIFVDIVLSRNYIKLQNCLKDYIHTGK